MSRFVASTLILTFLAAGPTYAADPVSPFAAEESAPTHASETPPTPAPAPVVATESAPAAVPEGPAPADEAAMASDERRQEIERLRKRRLKGLLAAGILLGVGTGLVSAGAEVVSSDGPNDIPARAELNAGIGLGIAGSVVALSAIIPAVIARRARNQANRLETAMAFTPGGWVARGTAGAGFTLRF